MTYNNIENNELAHLLYLFVCGYKKLDEAYDVLYKDDDFMKKVVDEAKDIAKKDGYRLFFPLTYEQIREKDEKYYIEQGIEKGIEKGIIQNKCEMVVNLYNNNVSVDTIAKCASLSIKDVENILKNK